MISGVDIDDSAKWNRPGWRIEQKYKTNVLIGNWNEERRVFERGSSHFNSTHRSDFKNYGKYSPDVTTRREAVLKHDGLGKKHIFSHHAKAYQNNGISWYDQQFNRREVLESRLPPLRSWDRQKLSWEPEKSDYPLQGAPTNFGLLQKLQEKWKKEAESDKLGIYVTTHGLSFTRHPRGAFILQHKATPRHLSSHFHPHRVNKDLHLRGVFHNSSPEYAPAIGTC